MATARGAINQFVFELLGNEDELFLTEFAGACRLLQQWTQDREAFSLALARANQPLAAGRWQPGCAPPGSQGTALFDAVAT